MYDCGSAQADRKLDSRQGGRQNESFWLGETLDVHVIVEEGLVSIAW